tara:strand:+ start:351 stop:569 length:219 start_codon:yes stop_codon:yes gene_type:complete
VPDENFDDCKPTCHNCKNVNGIYARTWEDIKECPEAYNYVDHFGIQTANQINFLNKDIYYCESCLAVWAEKS